MSDGAQVLGGTVGALIRARREKSGMTLRMLADLAGCGKSTLSMVETGERAPSQALIRKLASVLGLQTDELVRAATWESVPGPVREEVRALQGRQLAAQRLARLVASGWGGGGEKGGSALDEAYRSGELRRLVEVVSPGEGERPDARPGAGLAALLPRLVPLINKVAAGYPAEFTDLGYPARVADEYVRCVEVEDPDAFAARVVGDSMSPRYLEGDVVVFSPARAVVSGADCYARLEPDHESTFKRVYFETAEDGREMIRLQPLNSAYAARVVERERVAGLYAAVSVTRVVG